LVKEARIGKASFANPIAPQAVGCFDDSCYRGNHLGNSIRRQVKFKDAFLNPRSQGGKSLTDPGTQAVITDVVRNDVKYFSTSLSLFAFIGLSLDGRFPVRRADIEQAR